MTEAEWRDGRRRRRWYIMWQTKESQWTVWDKAKERDESENISLTSFAIPVIFPSTSIMTITTSLQKNIIHWSDSQAHVLISLIVRKRTDAFESFCFNASLHQQQHKNETRMKGRRRKKILKFNKNHMCVSKAGLGCGFSVGKYVHIDGMCDAVDLELGQHAQWHKQILPAIVCNHRLSSSE